MIVSIDLDFFREEKKARTKLKTRRYLKENERSGPHGYFIE